MNKRVLAFLSILSLFLSSPLIPVNAAAKAGAKCIKAGNTEVVKGKTYTCVKSGKKLFWNKGVIKSAKSISAAPTSFSNLYENRDGIAYAAWKSTADSIAAGKSNVSSLKIYIGPNTTAPKYKTPEIAIGLVSQAFSKYKTPENVHVIQYSVDDIKWADDKVKSIIDINDYYQDVENRVLYTKVITADSLSQKEIIQLVKNWAAINFIIIQIYLFNSYFIFILIISFQHLLDLIFN